MKLLLIGLMVVAVFQCALTQSPKVVVTEGILVGKTVQFSENHFINKTVDVDIFLVSVGLYLSLISNQCRHALHAFEESFSKGCGIRKLGARRVNERGGGGTHLVRHHIG